MKKTEAGREVNKTVSMDKGQYQETDAHPE